MCFAKAYLIFGSYWTEEEELGRNLDRRRKLFWGTEVGKERPMSSPLLRIGKDGLMSSSLLRLSLLPDELARSFAEFVPESCTTKDKLRRLFAHVSRE